MTCEGDADPYTESGQYAAVQASSRRRLEKLQDRLLDAHNLHARGLAVIERSKRHVRQGSVLMVLAGCTAVWLGYVSATAADGTYNGALRGNWCMLGCILMVGVMNFIWGWIASQRRQRETGHKLLSRAEYQRRLGALLLKEAEDEAVS